MEQPPLLAVTTTSHTTRSFALAPMETIVIADPDEAASKEVAARLRDAGWEALLVSRGDLAIRAVDAERPALLMVAMELPGVRGAEVLRRIRRDDATATLPIIAFSETGEEIDRVLAFELGADDFVKKPFSPRELILRIRAVLRRASGTRSTTRKKQVRVGPIAIDSDKREVRIGEDPVALTTIEFRLLVDLAERVGHVQRREQLLERIWPDADLGHRTVDTHIRRLREKLGDAAEWIETVRGVGYRLRAEEHEAAQSPRI